MTEWQDDWDTLLPIAEFAHNNHILSSTQTTPFKLDTGCSPHMDFKPHFSQAQIKSVDEFKERMTSALTEARAMIVKVKDNMAKFYDHKHLPTLEYCIGDKVYLDASDIKTTRPSAKLTHKFLDLYTVLTWVGSHAYCLKLPPSMSHLYNMFHVLKLRAMVPDPIPGRRLKLPFSPEL